VLATDSCGYNCPVLPLDLWMNDKIDKIGGSKDVSYTSVIFSLIIIFSNIQFEEQENCRGNSLCILVIKTNWNEAIPVT